MLASGVMHAVTKIFWPENYMALKAKNVVALSQQENSPIEHVHHDGVDDYVYNSPETRCLHRIQVNPKEKTVTIGEGYMFNIFEAAFSIEAFLATRYLSPEDIDLINKGQTLTSKNNDGIEIKIWGKMANELCGSPLRCRLKHTMLWFQLVIQ